MTYTFKSNCVWVIFEIIRFFFNSFFRIVSRKNFKNDDCANLRYWTGSRKVRFGVACYVTILPTSATNQNAEYSMPRDFWFIYYQPPKIIPMLPGDCSSRPAPSHRLGYRPFRQ
mmetsp:Transcript_34561/g.68038  ORF Transcript_34561/g.68038 Transcript_34561/m.68038 type:complete len:114 (-) Transcript_34561:459-800(-)